MELLRRRKLMKLTKKELIDKLEAAKQELSMTELDLNVARGSMELEKREKERLQDRIKFLSTCFDTLDQKGKVGQIKPIQSEERVITAEDFGEYIALTVMDEELIENAKQRIINDIAEAMVDNGIVQFIVKRPEEVGGPANMVGTVAAKLFVVPWEKMAYRKTKIKWWGYK